ncbi:MAG: hypothetical protein HKN72_01920 [Gemmatimonadetes bacterium]|nr:hypothetical protein [Gemmatimonadota bacterium]
MRIVPIAAVAALLALTSACRTGGNPYPEPIEATDGVIVVGYNDFAVLPESDNRVARPMLMVEEPYTGRFFVNDMRGPLHTVSDGGEVRLYLDLDDPRWGRPVEDSGRERGFQSFALHPQFGMPGTQGYGKLYTWSDTEDTGPEPDFVPGGGDDTHDTILLEWTASDATASSYDGGQPRQVLRLEQPFGNHNAGHMAFNPLSGPEDTDYGMLYVGVADGGSGGDPMDLSQDPGSVFGKILRIDPLGSNAANGGYGIPADNPHVGEAGVLAEIFATGVRNPQRFGWDPTNGDLFVADIGQNSIEELSRAWAGANLGWNDWEGSYRFIERGVLDMSDPRSDPDLSYPVAEYGHGDPLLTNRAAITGVVVYRDDAIPQLRGRLLFGDYPSGEIFHVSADAPPGGGEDAIRRVLLRDETGQRTFLEVIQATTEARGLDSTSRTDLRFAVGSEGRVFLLNKHDGVIREIVP